MKRTMLLAAALLCAAASLAQTTVAVTMKSKVLGEERTIFVGTPRQYDLPGTRYPVVYVTDAETQFNHTLTTADFLAMNHRMPWVIVVGITNTQRIRDFTPTPNSGRRTAQTYPGAGGAAKFREFLDSELIPYIDAKYRTAPYRILSGHSLGGLFAVDTLVTRPSMFNAVIAVSPSLDWDNDLAINHAKTFFSSRKEFPSTFFVALGNEGPVMQHNFDSIRGVLKKQHAKGFSWDTRQFPDEDHGSVVLLATYAGLEKVFEDWPLKRNPQTRAIETGWEGIQKHYRHLTEKYGFPVWVPEEVANQVGYQFLGQNKFQDAIEVLKANTVAYPNSANVFDSLGEAYEKSGEFDRALENYEKAVTLSAGTGNLNAATYREHYENLAKAKK